jgi:hypothetical protein
MNREAAQPEQDVWNLLKEEIKNNLEQRRRDLKEIDE